MRDLIPTADPLPRIALAPALDGSRGSNRARDGVCQIAAQTDVEAMRLWLAEYADSPHTLRCYRKEAARLLLWATRVRGKPLCKSHPRRPPRLRGVPREPLPRVARSRPAAAWTKPPALRGAALGAERAPGARHPLGALRVSRSRRLSRPGSIFASPSAFGTSTNCSPPGASS
jgi:hypothetical protein